MKEQLIMELMQRMLPHLDNSQLKQLREAMELTLYHYNVTKTEIKSEGTDFYYYA